MSYLTNTKSERLKFIPLDETYIEKWEAFLKNKTATRYFPDYGLTANERAHSWIHSQLERYKSGEYGMYALHLRSDNTFVGQGGLLKQVVEHQDELEIGYHLFPEFWGNGYATEAAKHLKNWAKTNELSDSVISIIHEENALSQAVDKRNGMKSDFKTRWKEMDVIIYRSHL